MEQIKNLKQNIHFYSKKIIRNYEYGKQARNEERIRQNMKCHCGIWFCVNIGC